MKGYYTSSNFISFIISNVEVQQSSFIWKSHFGESVDWSIVLFTDTLVGVQWTSNLNMINYEIRLSQGKFWRGWDLEDSMIWWVEMDDCSWNRFTSLERRGLEDSRKWWGWIEGLDVWYNSWLLWPWSCEKP